MRRIVVLMVQLGSMAMVIGASSPAAAHPIVDAVTSASRSINPFRACDFDRDGAINDSSYCKCDRQDRAGPGNYSRRGSIEFCSCDPATQHCVEDGAYADGTPRFKWAIDCNDFDANRYPQRCDANDCSPNWAQEAHCAGAASADQDHDGHASPAQGGADCNDQDPAIFPGAPEACNDGVDSDCDGLDCGVVDADRDGAAAGVDCDDNNAQVFPGARELCGNGVDDDCVDGDEPCAQDMDHDGHNAAEAGGGDCDDLNSSVFPGAVEIPDDGVDQDCDGADATAAQADVDQDGFRPPAFGGGDCDDADPAINPEAVEICGDGKDQDCDGADLACVAGADRDLDDYRDQASGGDDCDDMDSRVHPGAVEICGDGIDQDCDGADLVCDGLPAQMEPGVGSASTPNDGRRHTNRVGESPEPTNCEQVSGPLPWTLILLVFGGLWLIRRPRLGALWGVLLLGWVIPGTGRAQCVDLDNDGYEIWFFDRCGDDCNDLDPNIHPDIPEICGDGIDNNCNLQIDEGCEGGSDADGDGVAVGADCDDNNPAAFPGAPEICGDGIDQSCDGRDAPCVVDADGDGIAAELDCDDTNPAIRPGAPEICGDGVDQDCDGADSDCVEDADGDGVTGVGLGGADCDDFDAATYPGAPEICGDGRDQDCDGVDTPCDHDADGVVDAEDCNPWNPAVSPNAEEICGDGIDQDCDGQDPACMVDANDADGDGFIAVQLGGDDCQDYDRATHPGAIDVPDDGRDQDCSGADAVGTTTPPAAQMAFPTAQAHALSSGEGVPDATKTARCSTHPGVSPSPNLGLGLLALMGLLGLRTRTRRRSWLALAGLALLMLGCVIGGCAVEDSEAQALPALDPEFFAAHVEPLLARSCATLACHGNADRPLRLFSVSKLRIAEDRINTELGDDELCANFDASRAFVGGQLGSLLVSKPLYLEDGGTWHGGGYHFGADSTEDRCLQHWIDGATAEFDADGQALIPEACDFAWNVNASGQSARWTRTELPCAR